MIDWNPPGSLAVERGLSGPQIAHRAFGQTSLTGVDSSARRDISNAPVVWDRAGTRTFSAAQATALKPVVSKKVPQPTEVY
jgi:hypothetical protein